MKYLLDTHVWVWVHSDPENLSPRVKKVIESGNHELLLSTISLVELATLIEKKRVIIKSDLDAWIDRALESIPLTLAPVTEEIARETGHLSGFSHFDPADRIIVATAKVEGAILLTRDRVIQDYRRVKTLW